MSVHRKFSLSKEWMESQYINLGRSSADIAQEIGCSQPTILDAMREYKIVVRRGGNVKGRSLPRRCQIDGQEMKRLYIDELWSSKKLAKHFGCSSPTILSRLQDAGVNPRHHNDTKRGQPSPLRIVVNAAEIIVAYAKPHCAIEVVARQFDLSRAVVRRVLVENGVTIRSVSETIGIKRNGSNNPNWRPDLTPEERAHRRDSAMQNKWRIKVYEKDKHACQCCGDNRGGNLNAHHIEDYKTNQAKRWTVENGTTLCELCHRTFHKIYGYGGNDERQLTKFLSAQDREAA